MKKEESIKAGNSYEKGMLTAVLLSVFFSLPFFLKLSGVLEQIPLLVAAIPGIISLAVLIITLIIAKARKKQIVDFLSSDRVLLEWTYSYEESGRIKKEIYEESKEDFRLIFIGCTIVFGLVGFLSGILPGMNFPLFFGGWLIFGFCLGLIIGYGTKVQNEKEFRSKSPIYFAIGENEIFYKDEYFKANSSRPIKAVSFDEKSNMLSIITAGTKSFSKKEWLIKAPKDYVDRLLQILPKINVIEEENYEIDEEDHE